MINTVGQVDTLPALHADTTRLGNLLHKPICYLGGWFKIIESLASLLTHDDVTSAKNTVHSQPNNLATEGFVVFDPGQYASDSTEGKKGRVAEHYQ